MDKIIENGTKKLQSGITYRYVIALSLIAILSTVAFFTLLTAIKSTNSTAYIVNISGKQRMLSQHIALDVHRINELLSRKNSSSYGYELVKENLSSNAKEMLKANKILSTGNLPNQKYITLSPAIRDIYFGEMQLASRVEKYAKSALLLVEDGDNINNNEIKQFIDTHSESILIDLNKAVNQYQIEGEDQLEYIQKLETFVWILTIITLLLEVIFIFQPMAKKIASLSLINQKSLENLETIVELRTLHLENANNKLKHLASHDSLTGLRNRLELEKYIEDAIHQHKQHKAPYAIIMFDIDFFKSVNDTYGHEMGDTVLVEISNIIKSSIRENDKAFRAGGEEFVVLLNRITLEDTVNVTEKIKNIIQKHPFKKENLEFFKTISCGLYHSSLFEVGSVKNLLGLVDTALYQSKTNGRNRLTVVDKTMDMHIEKVIVPKTVIIFTDKTFSKILKIENESIYINQVQLKSNEKSFLSLVHQDDLYLLDNLPKEILEEKPYKTTIRILDSYHNIHIYRMSIYEKENKNVVVCLEDAVLLAQNISDATLLKAFQAMLDNSDDYIYFKDKNHIFITASQSLVAITSVEKREDFAGKIDYQVFPHELADEYFKLEREVFDNGKSVAQELQPTVDKEGNKAWVDNRKYPIYNEHGDVIGLFGIARVIPNSKML